MNARGFTLTELLIGTAVAGIVGAIALAVLWRAGLVAARAHADVRIDADAWLALAAISRDLRAASQWRGCLDSDACAIGAPRRVGSSIVAGNVQWFADDGLWRCERKEKRLRNPWVCDRFLDSVASVQFVADLRRRNGWAIRRDYGEGDGDRAKAIEVIVWTRKSRPYSRTTGLHERAH
ncbi:prepilin-type N-terminal cleavage/methylation domain-containing protein [Lutibacter sp. SG786]|uniref:prepilin-type N-terminal cleavage/methylation domain-containing protein n=1 Tax=Luteibacter sp. SG786 TaxID=2587130 RepID=UPI00141E33AD|nr:prepilin-type N-terminal cleavage/methylation domain-containing protein [Luteibacter sp. SG786]